MLEIINKKEYDKICRDVIYKLQTSEERSISLTFSKDKVIKSIMSLEKKLFMPQHIPKGTREDPDNPDFKEFTQAEKDACWCPSCRYPVEFWDKKEIIYLLNHLRNLEEMDKTPA